MFKFIHAADLHLDSPLRGLERYDGAPVETIRQAPRRALENLVQLALDEAVAFVLIAGDLYDGDLKDYNACLFLVRQLTKLRDAKIPVFLISGNHDAQNKMTKILALPSNVRRLSTTKPETVHVDDCDVIIHGQGFASSEEMNNLALKYPPADPKGFNIGLLHSSVDGREGHASYAPCTLEDMRSRQYDYWALGHIHKREILHKQPFIVFPGNVQGRHIRETGPKGCILATVDDGNNISLEFRALDVIRWELCSVNAADADSGEQICEEFAKQVKVLMQEADDRLLALRVEVTGACPAHVKVAAAAKHWTGQIRATAIEESSGRVWVEKVKLQTTLPGTLDPLQMADGPLGDLLHFVKEIDGDEGMLDQIGAELADLAKKLPSELCEGQDGLDLTSPQGLKRMLYQAEQLLVGRLFARGTAP